jgi:hypothetical protein
MYLAGASAMALQITELLDRCSRTEGELECSRQIVREFIARLPESTVAPGDTREERAWWFITSAIPALPKNVSELFMAAGKMPKREPSAGEGLEHVPTRDLYSARTAQLKGRPWPGKENIMEVREQIDTTVARVEGAIYALMGGKLGEFSPDSDDVALGGDTGIVEVRIEKGKILGVCVARLDDARPEMAPGVRRVWELTPDHTAAFFSARAKVLMAGLTA